MSFVVGEWTLFSLKSFSSGKEEEEAAPSSVVCFLRAEVDEVVVVLSQRLAKVSSFIDGRFVG